MFVGGCERGGGGLQNRRSGRASEVLPLQKKRGGGGYANRWLTGKDFVKIVES